MPDETDFRRWADPGNYAPGWEPRSAEAARLCRSRSWVCDIGCGLQLVRHHLREDCVYLPADLQLWTQDTLRCDLNAGVLPTRYLQLCDVVLLLGVIEYIQLPSQAL